MKKLGFLLLALTAQVALAAPQPNVAANQGNTDGNWTAESLDKNAKTTQLDALNSATLNIGNMINADLDEKISQRLREQAERR